MLLSIPFTSKKDERIFAEDSLLELLHAPTSNYSAIEKNDTINFITVKFFGI